MAPPNLALPAISLLFTSFCCAAPDTAWSGALETIKCIRAQGQGNDLAKPAWKLLAAGPSSSIPALLEAMDGANDYSANWLRSAVETISQRDVTRGGKLPLDELEKHLLDVRHTPRARRMAYELISKTDASRARKLLPGFLNDPGSELRREAVQQVVEEALKTRSNGDKAAAIAGFQRALGFARDVDQIEGIAKQLTELGQKVDLQKTFGWVTKWALIAPFDNVGGAGFERVFPPELKIDLTGEFDGKANRVRWLDYETRSEYGMVDFNKTFTALKGAAGYAYAEFVSPVARDLEIRLGCKTGWKVWLNGRYLFGRDEYHRGVEIDQYRMPVQLDAGINRILVKNCQNEQTENWASEWEFQLRITDSLGTPIVSAR
ncbi:MAG: hypothetical protein EXS36_13085 [Pedosphaera sp.]|nr:hypothetical protein [Pedosphaera sp.]